MILSAHGQEASAWSQAWDYLGDPSATDTPEDRLTRAIVLSRGPEPSQRREAIETLEQLVNDLPAGLSAVETARATLIRLYVQDKQPEKAVTLLETEAKLANANAATVAAYAEALLLVKQWDQAETQIDRLAALAPKTWRRRDSAPCVTRPSTKPRRSPSPWNSSIKDVETRRKAKPPAGTWSCS